MNELPFRVKKILALLEDATKSMQPPLSVLLGREFGRDPFIILISCLLSLRARDTVTYGVSQALFRLAQTPREIINLPLTTLEELFYPLGFYRKKAQVVKEVSAELIERFEGKVPNSESALVSIKGVGRKTANLVLGEAFSIPAICVDTHVHRIANRLGWVATSNPYATELELRRIVPTEYWIALNHLFVMWGQNICVPLSPFCSKCVISSLCPKKGVNRSR